MNNMFLKLSKILFFFIFISAPLAFGTTEPWSYAVMELCTGFAVLFYFISVIKNHDELYNVPGFVPLFLFLFYILFQIIPLPPFIVEWLSPDVFQIHQTTNLLTGTNSWMCLSVNRKATLSEFFRYATYAMFYVLTVQLLRKKKMLQATVFTIVLFGGLLAFSSILQFYLTKDMALWFRYCPVNSIVVGPYVNHNHYAGLMEMIFPIVLGLFLYYRPRIDNTSFIKGIVEILGQEKANIHILIGASAILVITSIFVSLSRGAMVSTCLALLIFTFFLLKRKISRGNTIFIIGLIILTALSIGWFGWDQIFERFAKLKNAQGIIYESRFNFWKDTLNIIRHYAITGSGIGTFPHIYPLHRTIISDLFLTHAHNDYLELLAEGGVIGFSFASLFLLSFFYKTHRVFLQRRDGFSIYLYIGCITAMVSILFHSFTDFNMHIGANCLWFFFVAGIAVSAANTGIRHQSRETRLALVKPVWKKTGFASVFFAVAALTIIYNISNSLGMFYYSNIKNYSMSAETPSDIIKNIEKISDFAAIFDPFNSEYPFIKANADWFSENIGKSKSDFIKSLRLDPLNSRHLERFGLFLDQQGYTDKAGVAFKKSMIYQRTNAEYTFQYATWLLAGRGKNKIEDKGKGKNNDKGIDKGKTVQGNNIQSCLKYMKKTLTLNEKYFDRVLTALIVAGISDREIGQAIPKLPGPYIDYANFLSSIGSVDEAIKRYRYALDLIDVFIKKKVFDQKQQFYKARSYYFKIYRFFRKRNDLKNAMQTLERAGSAMPMDAGIKVALGDIYYNQGILYKAREEYDRALLIDPKNKRALRMMKKISQ